MSMHRSAVPQRPRLAGWLIDSIAIAVSAVALAAVVVVTVH